MKKLAQTGGEGQTPASIAQTAQQNNKLEPDAVNKKIDYTMDASIKSKMNKIMSGDAAGQNQKDNPFTLGADRGQDVDIRNIVNATSYYKTMKDNYNKGSVGGDAGLQQAKKDANKQVPTLSQLQKKGGLQP